MRLNKTSTNTINTTIKLILLNILEQQKFKKFFYLNLI